MDNRRLILLLIFGLSLFMLWDAWLKHNNPPAPVAASQQNTRSVDSAAIPQASASLSTDPSVPVASPTAARAPTLKIRTDSLVADISADGGDIVRLALTRHKATDDKTKNFVLLDNGSTHLAFYAGWPRAISGALVAKEIFKI